MKKKSAFTVAEILITMAIIGIISVAGITTVSHIDKSVKYMYSNVYHSLDKALYNAMFFTNIDNPFSKTDNQGNDMTPQARVTFLCRMLTEYFNTRQRSCNLAGVSQMGNAFGNPHFTASNGVRFYISSMLPADENASHHFFLVFADMNGEKRPNSMAYNPPDTEPDIFAFAALDIGRICPLGPPEVDTNYMSTRVTYFEEQPPNADGEITMLQRYSNSSRPYYVSKAEAWGYYTGQLDDSVIIDANPLTYNDYVRANVDAASLIYSFMGGKNTKFQLPQGITLRDQPVADGGYNCRLGSDIECDVIIDKYSSL